MAVSNPGFETSLAGWRKGTNLTTLARTCTVAHGGSCSAQLGRRNSTGDAMLDDWPETVASTAKAAYTATAWVRAPSGRSIKLRLRELRASTVLRTKLVTVTGTGAWRRVTVATSAAGGTSLSVEVRVSLTAGAKAYVDDVSLIRT